MLSSPIRDASAAWFNRAPPQSGQSVKVTARSTKARRCGCRLSLSLARKDFRTRGTRPSYVMLMVAILTLTGSE